MNQDGDKSSRLTLAAARRDPQRYQAARRGQSAAGNAAAAMAAAAYDATGTAWQDGPGPIYDRLAATVVGLCPVALADRRVLDLGAGTGAASRALGAAGATVTAVDYSAGMLGVAQEHRPPPVAADAGLLPFADRSFAAVIAAFVVTHLADPIAGMREAARVTQPGGPIIVSTFASEASHPAKAAVHAVARRWGWRPPLWYRQLQRRSERSFGSEGSLSTMASQAGLISIQVIRQTVVFGSLTDYELVRWRLGMAHLAPFVSSLGPGARHALVEAAVRAASRVSAPLELSILVLVGHAPEP